MSDDESMEHVQEHIHHHAHGASETWIGWAALTAAILAALAAIGGALASENLNESNLARITANDTWGEYQAKSIKSAILKTKMSILEAIHHDSPKTEVKAAVAEPAAEAIKAETTEAKTESKTEAKSEESGHKAKTEGGSESKAEAKPQKLSDKEQLDQYEDEKKELFDKAKELEAESTDKTIISNTFEHGVTLFHIAIAIVAISVLTKRKPFWFVSVGFGAIGIVFIIKALIPHVGHVIGH